jgi:hypothetical protein
LSLAVWRKALLPVAGLCVLLAGGVGLGHARQLLVIGVAYKAKVLCSGVFVSGRDAEAVSGEDLAVEDLAPLRAIDATVDWAGHSVQASFLGGMARTAVYRPGRGCALLAEGQAQAGEAPALSAGPAPTENRPAEPPQDPSRPGRLAAALDWAFAEPDPARQRRTRAVVILQHGKLVAERYAPGFSADMPLAGWSLAKSVMNALVGVLVGEGRLDLAAPVAAPEWQAPGDPRRAITLGQLLRMSGGLEFSEQAGEPLGDVTRMLMRAPDAAAYAASKPLAAAPGTLWHYASGSTNLISRLIRSRLGEAAYREFPRRALFGPLGMDSARLETDASGTFVGSSFLYATARDWAKFGQLYLQDGVWQGKRMLPPGWVRYSATPSPAASQYGAHFWLDIAEEYRHSDPERPLPPGAFHALGYEGQCVSIIPSHGLVVVRLGLTRTASAWRQDRFIHRIIDALSGEGGV